MLEQGGGFFVLAKADEIFGVLDEGVDFVLFDLGGALVEEFGLLSFAVTAVEAGEQDEGFAIHGVLANEILEVGDGELVLTEGHGDFGAEAGEAQFIRVGHGESVDGLNTIEEAVREFRGAAAGEHFGLAEWPGDVLLRVGGEGVQITFGSEVEEVLGEIDIAEIIQDPGVGLAHAADDLIIARGPEGFAPADKCVGLVEPIIEVVGVLLDEFLEEAGGLVIFLLSEETTGDAEFPIEVRGGEQQGFAIGGFGGEIVGLDEVAIAEDAVDIAVLAAEFEGSGVGRDGLVEQTLLDVSQSGVLVGAEEIREFPDGGGIGGDGGVEIAKFELEIGEGEIEGGTGFGGDPALEEGDGGRFIGADEWHEGGEELLFLRSDFGFTVGHDAVGAEEAGDEGGIAPELGAYGGGRLGARGAECDPGTGEEGAG